MVTQSFTPEQQAAVERVEADLISGRYFRLIEAANKSVPLGGPPVVSRNWAQMMEAVARFGTMGDRSAETAFSVIHRVNMYSTVNECIAQVAGALAEVASKGWYDTHRATGPEPGRPSSHQHPTDLRTALYMALLMVEVKANAGWHGSVPTVGWVVRHLVEREGLTVYPMYLPKVAAMLAD